MTFSVDYRDKLTIRKLKFKCKARSISHGFFKKPVSTKTSQMQIFQMSIADVVKLFEA